MNKIVEQINKENLFVVSSHVSPDGDNVGSCIGMTRFLRNLGKEAYYVLDDFLPSNLSFLYEDFHVLESDEMKKIMKERSFTLIALDCGDKRRLKLSQHIIEASEKIINIDHHESNNFFGDYNYVEPKASSTCELVYNVLEYYDAEKIDKNIATALYTGLTTDTGNFKYESAGISSFNLAAKLIKKGADKQEVVRAIFQSDSFNYVKMRAEAMLTLTKEDNFSYMVLEKTLLEKYKIDFQDLEELPSDTVNIDGVELGILFKEKEANFIKISFRSKQWANCNEIAKIFGGGGHERSAGCTIDSDIRSAVFQVLHVVREYMENHGRSN